MVAKVAELIGRAGRSAGADVSIELIIAASAYPVKGRGGQGVISIQTNERNGEVVGAVQVDKEDEVMLITNSGTLVRIAVNDISEMGRNTQGVRLIRLTNNEKLVEIEKIESIEDTEE